MTIYLAEEDASTTRQDHCVIYVVAKHHRSIFSCVNDLGIKLDSHDTDTCFFSSLLNYCNIILAGVSSQMPVSS